MEKRRARRTKRRLNCALVLDGKRVSGIVIDVSATGLFVQTSANPRAGSEIGLEVDIPGEKERLSLAVRVARRKVVPPRLRSVAHAGLGLQILSAPEAYFGYVAQLQPGAPAEESVEVDETADQNGSGPPSDKKQPASAPPSGAKKRASAPPSGTKKNASAPPSGAKKRAPAPPSGTRQARFRVRVSQITGSRSRSMEVSAASEEDARREALAASGDGWKILACDRVT